MPTLGAWGNLEDIMIMISEISQTERKTACSHCMWMPERFSLKKKTKKPKKHNKAVCQGYWGREGKKVSSWLMDTKLSKLRESRNLMYNVDCS